MGKSHSGALKLDDSNLIIYHPVICTASIPSATIDLFLQRANDYIDWLFEKPEKAPIRPLILTSPDIPNIQRASRVPSVPFETPFTDQPMEPLREWFEHNVMDRKEFTDCSFLVLDEHSAEYESITVACTRGGDLEVVYCEFDVAMEISMTCDIGNHMMSGETLDEYVGTEKVLTKRAWLG